MNISRRGILAGLGSVLAAPAVVSAINLMPVRSIERLLYPEPARWGDGYLITNGAVVNRSHYPNLFAAIGETFGAPSPTTFRLPDCGRDHLNQFSRPMFRTDYVIKTTNDAGGPAGLITIIVRIGEDYTPTRLIT